MAGKNLMIYFGGEADPLLDKFEDRFEISPHPIIVVTALAEDYRVYALYFAAEAPTPPAP